MLRRLYFPVILLLVVWLGYAVAVHSNNPPNKSYIQIETAPSGAAVKLDGHGAGDGKTTVVPGKHSVIVQMSGFATVTRAVSVGNGQTVYVGVALQPDTPSTKNWYATHPDDQRVAGGIGSHEADYVNQVANQGNPFLKQLPLAYGDGQGSIVSIAQGVPLKAGGPPAVYVTAAMPADRQGALTYMRSRGYDPATMDMVFIGQANPLVHGNE